MLAPACRIDYHYLIQFIHDSFFVRSPLEMNKNQKLLLESPQLQEEKNPSRSSKSSSGSYLLHITSLGSYYAASSSSPSNVIDLFDKSTLRGIQTLPGHEQGTTSLHTIENLSGVLSKCLVSSGKDRTIKVWDERSNSCSIQSVYYLIFLAESAICLTEAHAKIFSVSDELGTSPRFSLL